MLSGDEIRQRAIVIGAIQNCYRAASYDVRVGTITAVESQRPVRLSEGTFYTIPAQGMVEVMSLETIRVPPDLAGYASVKTDLSRRGLLALNTGILDPGYDGPISAVMVNFGRAAFSLSAGDVFLRLTFHPYNPEPEFNPPRPVAREEFQTQRRKEVGERFASTFLDISGRVEEIAREVFPTSVRRLLTAASAAGLALSIFALIATVGISYGQKWFLSEDQIKAELGAYFRSAEFASFQRRLSDVEKKELSEEIQKSVDEAVTRSLQRKERQAQAGASVSQKKQLGESQ